MSKKMKIIPSIFKNQWPSCNHPKTLSFSGGENFRATYLDVDPDESLMPTKYSSNPTDHELGDEAAARSLEAVIGGVRRSQRLFFEPEETSSIVNYTKISGPFKGSVAMALESDDPYSDFKKSMAEMVESEKMLKDWDCLEELLLWYLKMNSEMNHRFIVRAFVDLVVGFADVDAKKAGGSDSTSTTSYLSASSSSFSSPSSPLSS